jgi:hypothetical protein
MTKARETEKNTLNFTDPHFASYVSTYVSQTVSSSAAQPPASKDTLVSYVLHPHTGNKASRKSSHYDPLRSNSNTAASFSDLKYWAPAFSPFLSLSAVFLLSYAYRPLCGIRIRDIGRGIDSRRVPRPDYCYALFSFGSGLNV